jgi:flagellar motor protein MotB
MPHAATRGSVARGLVAVLALAIGLVTLGCSASRTRAQSRAKVLEAEVIDLNQQADALRRQAGDAIAGQDEAVARLQQVEFEKGEYERRADSASSQASEAIARASAAENRLDAAERAADEWKSRYDTLASKPAPPAPPVQPPARTGAAWAGESPELAALKRDLQDQMSRRGISMPVEVRTDRDGTRRVAVVIPDAFKSGQATLAYNPAAVKAVVGLGKLVQEHYPQATITVEGHTDSDPLVKSKPRWGTNENLSLARADYVKKLLADTGVPNGQIQSAGLGSRHPIELGGTARAKSRNRRVEVFITP